MADKESSAADASEQPGFLVAVLIDLFTKPVNLILLGVCFLLIYKLFFSRRSSTPTKPADPELPPLKKQDFTVEQLGKYDGTGPDGRILVAVNGKVFDVTRGKRFYGPGAPYGVFAGRDASRGLATFSLTEDVLKPVYDDLSDLNSMQMESVREWEMQFTEKYIYTGKLLRQGDKPTEYSDTETEDSSAAEKSKND
ncbi:membrane-associated progesterone receptor component 1-like [Lineus longissimus]|uniref:membrane-associated progesterone receptor component 1-like n=1 Tax=Lineus longissimus TaxID=88925 RepID=UPI00315D4A39